MHAPIRTLRFVMAGAVVALTLGVAAPAFARNAKAAKTYTAKTINVKGTEYKFLGVPSTVKAGTHTISLTNVGTQEHMAVVFKLKPGKTLQDAIAYQGDSAAPESPVVSVATVDVITPNAGTVATFTTVFTPGTYVMACFANDPEGKTHFDDGMVKTFKVVK